MGGLLLPQNLRVLHIIFKKIRLKRWHFQYFQFLVGRLESKMCFKRWYLLFLSLIVPGKLWEGSLFLGGGGGFPPVFRE